jgi:hypothetical protein
MGTSRRGFSLCVLDLGEGLHILKSMGLSSVRLMGDRLISVVAVDDAPQDLLRGWPLKNCLKRPDPHGGRCLQGWRSRGRRFA